MRKELKVIGRNKILMNQATLDAAVQSYLNTEELKCGRAVQVTGVRRSPRQDGDGPWYVVTVESPVAPAKQPKEAADGK